MVSGEINQKSFLKKVMEKPTTAAVFLDCLDCIEYVGVKWICYVHIDEFTPAMQKHATEEYGHHEMLTKLSRNLRLSMNPQELFEWQQMTEAARKVTEAYLQKLFRKCASAIVAETPKENRNRNCYYLLSLLIERRLIFIYSQIVKTAQSQDIQKAISQIIVDERQHIAGVSGGIMPIAEASHLDIDQLATIEAEFADDWFEKLSKIIGWNNEDSVALSGLGRSI